MRYPRYLTKSHVHEIIKIKIKSDLATVFARSNVTLFHIRCSLHQIWWIEASTRKDCCQVWTLNLRQVKALKSKTIHPLRANNYNNYLFLNLFRCFNQPVEPTRRVSLSVNAAPLAITTTLHSCIDKNINNNNNLLANNSGSDNYDLSQPSFSMHKQDNIDYNEILRCENIESINNDMTIIE